LPVAFEPGFFLFHWGVLAWAVLLLQGLLLVVLLTLLVCQLFQIGGQGFGIVSFGSTLLWLDAVL
jgi:hypothetical protein